MKTDYLKLALEAVEFYWLSIYRGESMLEARIIKRETFSRYLREVRKAGKEDKFMSLLALHGIDLDRDVVFPISKRIKINEVYRSIYFSAIRMQRRDNYGGWGAGG